MPQVVQFPAMQQTIPVQVPINMGNGQTVYQTVHVPLQTFASQMPGLMQPQMQICQPMPQIANIITPNGQIQQVQLAPMNQLQGIHGLQNLQQLQQVQQHHHQQQQQQNQQQQQQQQAQSNVILQQNTGQANPNGSAQSMLQAVQNIQVSFF